MFIGEGPGAQEDQQGKPFVGPAGQLLSELLNSVGLSRGEVFITNMVKCRPPNNRDPYPDEISACSEHLNAQIAIINPKAIVPLGSHALKHWFPHESISKAHGTTRTYQNIQISPQYHPAAALHNPSLKSTIKNDFQTLVNLLSTTGQNQEEPFNPVFPSEYQISLL